MKIKKDFTTLLIPFYYLIYFIQQQYIFLIIAFIILFKLFLIDKYVNLVQLFLVIIPEILPFDPSFYFKNTSEFINGFYFFTFIDPILIASILCLIRNIITFKATSLKNLFILLLIIIIFHFYQLITTSLPNIENAQGFTYGLKSLLYFNAIFLVNQTPLDKLKKELLTIIEISLILYLTKLFFGHYIFYTVAFAIVYFKVKKNIPSLIIMVWVYYLALQGLDAITTISISFLSFVVVASNSYNYLFKRSLLLFFIFNFSIIVYFLLSYFHPFLTQFINNNYFEIRETGNILLMKILLDRLPLFLAAIDQSNYVFANFNHIDLYGYSNMIKTDEDWGFGVHNYFLSMYFKVGFLSALIVFFIINVVFFNVIKLFKKLEKKIKHNILDFFKYFFSVSLIFYWTWSFTGNSFGESVGFFFFLIIGTIYTSLKKTTLSNKDII